MKPSFPLLALACLLCCSCGSGWKLYTAHEFNDSDTRNGFPLGFEEQKGGTVNRDAKVDVDRCVFVKDGILHIKAYHLDTLIDNGYGKQVEYIQGAIRSASKDNPEFWCTFTENMRIEVRARRDAVTGINDAIWFMPNAKIKWPAGGEIDLLENPKKKVNNRAHFTLHSENYHTGGDKNNSVSAITKVEDMSDWNTYWMEWYPDKIIGGVNDTAYFEHHYGDAGNTDWPWSNPEGFYLILSRGLSTDPNRWMGAVDPSTWPAGDGPSMDIDWIRVYKNRKYKGAKAPKVKYY